MGEKTAAFLIGSLITLVLYAALRAIAQPAPLTGVPYVIDGDTIAIGQTHIRLYGIDAPESDQPCKDKDGATYRCGLLATSALEAEIAGRAVSCNQVDTDRYGRTVAICTLNGVDLGRLMVLQGMAIDYRRYDREGRYLAAELEARGAARGTWQGVFMEPEEWRHRR